MSAPRILGLDPSLTSFGVAMPDGTTLSIKSKLKGVERLADIRSVILGLVDDVDLVVCEGYAYGAANKAPDLGELGGTIRLALWDACIPYVIVQPTNRAKYATGTGNAAKATVAMAIAARTGRSFGDYDQVDAWILRAMGLDHYGHPEIEVPATHRVALNAIAWPELGART